MSICAVIHVDGCDLPLYRCCQDPPASFMSQYLLCSQMHVAMQGLNIDGGREIKIRLIEFGSKDQYLPYEAIIGTMLHELCHNEVGPHNAQFYKLLDQITLVRQCTSYSSCPFWQTIHSLLWMTKLQLISGSEECFGALQAITNVWYALRVSLHGTCAGT